MSSASARSHRPSISPFRSRKSPEQPPPPLPAKSAVRPLTPPSATSSRHSSSPVSSGPSPNTGPTFDLSGTGKAKENVTVTVRFRPLSSGEINRGDEIAWYADGGYTVRNEYNSSIAYGFDRVFGPATTTRHVYDIAAQHVVSGVMQGINGTVFAYGVTSSGKTHTMHGEQKSPGVIPLAVKEVFGIIQETPVREFLLRVSYLEIYNEVINDLLNPTGQNLRIREDSQGIYVEGIKEEVVLSPAHALSLIASGEEHRHVGSNNVNLLSSRSHTIFTLTIESSPHGENPGGEDVTLSQLHLIDLAGSESSKTETTGLRRKEGSFINKSLLTLGTVICKLTDGKATHIPYRDSKLTRLLQSSLSGHGRISLICNVTPASSNSEETHNTLKFAHRSKHVEIKASQNKIMDEKSLIKKYQKEISCLKQELQQLKRGMVENPYMPASSQEDLVNLKLQLEAGQVKLQSRLEEEEQAKAALMGRIQRLTKLILVSTKNSLQSSHPERSSQRRRHSFGEDELAYLPDKKRDYRIEEDSVSYASELSTEGRDDVTNLEELVKDYKRNRRTGMLGWFKVRRRESLLGSSRSPDSEASMNGSLASFSLSSESRVMFAGTRNGQRKSISRKGDDPTVASFPERTQAGDLFSATVAGHSLPPTGTTISDQMDLLQEQMKVLAGEVALSSSSFKRLLEQADSNPEDSQVKEQMQKLKGEIIKKKHQMQVLEQRMIGSVGMTSCKTNSSEISQALSKLTTQLNEKTFELEIKSADNRILQEQLQMKVSENIETQETILLLRQQVSSLMGMIPHNQQKLVEYEFPTPGSLEKLSRQDKAAEIEDLKQEAVKMIEEKDGLEIQSQKLAEEASYAKELAAAAAVELRNLAEEVTRLSYENAKLTDDLASAIETPCRSTCCQQSVSRGPKQNIYSGSTRTEDYLLIEELQKKLNSRYQKEAEFEATLCQRGKIETELRGRLDEARQREEALENELANMWVLVAKIKKSGNAKDIPFEEVYASNACQAGRTKGSLLLTGHLNQISKDDTLQSHKGIAAFEDLKASYQKERGRCNELEILNSRFKGEDISGMDVTTLEELHNFHIEAITRICQAKMANS
ncbi:hypothetical protein K2173_028572 [Erythroxylum novogranatense]|uniref:Kinesin motor domain-containing protein n=1 Tax=Erythroxylum novogranatense TaxID=1862640 RepID=A0AAV8U2G5_9ROSI|nr:hypothetical protein K2173_028572 [Erythroxylum novogranatense]